MGNKKLEAAAPVFDICRGSFHDGSGVRTVVYLKGCPLRCLWCHNPEGQACEPQILFYPIKCISCGACATICPLGLHIADEEGRHVFNRSGCAACGKCAGACPAKALALCGNNMTADSVMEVIRKDKKYFLAAGGGVTISGGEALLYPDFVAELFGLCRSEGIDTAVETSLCVPRENLLKILPPTDLLIADFKHSDSETHRALTGADNKLIKENLYYAAQNHNNIWIRIPLIPGLNDDEENLKSSARFIKALGGAVKKVELLKFNNLYENKYDALGLDVNYNCKTEPQSDEELARKYEMLE